MLAYTYPHAEFVFRVSLEAFLSFSDTDRKFPNRWLYSESIRNSNRLLSNSKDVGN